MHVAVQGGFDPERRQLARRLHRSLSVLPAYSLCGWTGERMLGEWGFDFGPHALRLGRPDDLVAAVVVTGLGEPRELVQQLRWQADFDHTDLARAFDWADVPVPSSVAALVVDGEPEPFELWEEAGLVRGAASIAGFSLGFEARGIPVDGLGFERADDLSPYLDGWRRAVRAFGGG